MADLNLGETPRIDQPNRLQVSEKRKLSNCLRSIVAGAGMLAVSLLVFDWYFFSAVDGISSTLRPIAAVFRQATGDRQPRPLPGSSVQQHSRDRSVSLLVPVRSAGNPKLQQTDANPNLFVANQANRNWAIGCGKDVNRDNGNRPLGGFKKKDGTMSEQISAWPIGANTASIIQSLKPILINQEFTKMSTKIDQFSYVSKLVALTHLYVELSLPLPAALRAAEADLR
jgi:hypothetical protein